MCHILSNLKSKSGRCLSCTWVHVVLDAQHQKRATTNMSAYSNANKDTETFSEIFVNRRFIYGCVLAEQKQICEKSVICRFFAITCRHTTMYLARRKIAVAAIAVLAKRKQICEKSVICRIFAITCWHTMYLARTWRWQACKLYRSLAMRFAVTFADHPPIRLDRQIKNNCPFNSRTPGCFQGYPPTP